MAQVAERFHAMCAGVPAEDGGTPRNRTYASAARQSTGGGAIAGAQGCGLFVVRGQLPRGALIIRRIRPPQCYCSLELIVLK